MLPFAAVGVVVVGMALLLVAHCLRRHDHQSWPMALLCQASGWRMARCRQQPAAGRLTATAVAAAASPWGSAVGSGSNAGSTSMADLTKQGPRRERLGPWLSERLGVELSDLACSRIIQTPELAARASKLLQGRQVRCYFSKGELDKHRGSPRNPGISKRKPRIAYLDPRSPFALIHFLEEDDSSGAVPSSGGGGLISVAEYWRKEHPSMAAALGLVEGEEGEEGCTSTTAGPLPCIAVLKAEGGDVNQCQQEERYFRYYPVGACTIEVQGKDGEPAKARQPGMVWGEDGCRSSLPPWVHAALDAPPAEQQQVDSNAGGASSSACAGRSRQRPSPFMQEGFDTLLHQLVPAGDDTRKLVGRVTGDICQLVQGGLSAEGGSDLWSCRGILTGGSVTKGTNLAGR
jgi:hypothetical protein